MIIYLSFTERVTDDYVYDLLYSAKEAHMNMLRVWGGKFMFYVQIMKIYAYQWVIFSLFSCLALSGRSCEDLNFCFFAQRAQSSELRRQCNLSKSFFRMLVVFFSAVWAVKFKIPKKYWKCRKMHKYMFLNLRYTFIL